MRIPQLELEAIIEKLLSRGYKRYNGHYKNEHYGYWKTFLQPCDSERKVFQIAFLFYDYSQYPNCTDQSIGVQFECLLLDVPVARMDLSVSDDKMEFEKFELLCQNFYKMSILSAKNNIL